MKPGGACDKLFSANSFNEISTLNQSHGKEMIVAGDETHLEAMAKMNEIMKDSNRMQSWIEDKEKEFNSLPND